MVLNTTVPELCFPYELDTLEFSGGRSEMARVTITVDDIDVLDSDLVCNEGTLFLYDLAGLFLDYLRNMPQTVKISIDGIVAKTTKMLPCDVQMSVSAEDFTARSFLSLCNVRKETTEDAEELLSFYGAAGLYSAVVRLEYVDGALTAVSPEERSLSIDVKEEGITTFSIPVKDYRKEGYHLIGMKVDMGGKTMLYDVRKSCADFAQLRFLNTFGCMETAHFTNVTAEHQTDFQTARINGRMTNFSPEDKMEYEGIRAFVPDRERDMYCDLAGSTVVVRCEDEQSVYIKSSSVKDESSRQGFCTARMKWMLTGRRLHFEPHFRMSVFDSTFDATFD